MFEINLEELEYVNPMIEILNIGLHHLGFVRDEIISKTILKNSTVQTNQNFYKN